MDENTKFEKALKLFFLITPIIMGLSFLYGFFSGAMPADCKRSSEDFEINYQLNSTKYNFENLAKKMIVANNACGKDPTETKHFNVHIDPAIVEIVKNTNK